MTIADYQTWEAKQTEHHQFLDDEIFAKAATVDGYMALHHRLSGTACQTYVADMHLHFTALGNYFYLGSAANFAYPTATSEPKIIIEVLTAAPYPMPLGLSSAIATSCAVLRNLY